MKLIIAEKPSLARNIIAGIGTMKKCDGYYEGCGYTVSWAFGHLFSLCDIEKYTGDPPKSKWSMSGLPCFPERFQFELRSGDDGKVDSGVVKQFDILCDLMNRPDCEAIINAGDADREGEIIVRLIIKHGLKSNKPILRLWLPDQTPETVKAALMDMKSDYDYNNLAYEGYARTYIDWLYGVNLTRYATLRTGTLLRVGRVIVPIVKAIYDRDMTIRNFVPDIYYALVSKAETNGEVVELTSQYKFPKDQKTKAENACSVLNAQKAVVTDKKTKKDTLKPGKLYSLSKLQNYLGKKYKMPMDESLEIIQHLYEEGYLTYPRTNSEYLATAEKDKIREIIANIAKLGYPVEFKDSKTIFDDSKIESHSALTPTYKLPDLKKLSEKERQVYMSVLNRFVAVFCSKECVAQKTEMTIAVGDKETFTLKGTVILEPGWTEYDDTVSAGRLLPNLKKGDVINIDFKPVEKQTNPPKHYTIETLNNYLKNPFREDKKNVDSEDDTEEYKAMFEGVELGTEATRTGIIANAVKSKYIDLKKDVYTILPNGEYLIRSLERLGISMDKYKTSSLGKALKSVYHAEMTVDGAVALAKDEISEVFNHASNDETSESYTGSYMDIIGTCPLCGKSIIKGKYGYSCSGYKEGCKFHINDYLCNKTISVKTAKALLAGETVGPIEGFSSKKGNTFTASLKIIDGKVEFVFPENSKKEAITSEEIGKCPVCGKPVYQKNGFYGCSGYQEGCKFSFNATICDRDIDIDTAKELLSKKRVGPLNGFHSKDGSKVFPASLVIKDGKVQFEF